jgi:hypothetical protein
MLTLPGKLLRAVSDVTVGTAIVMVHVMLADRERLALGERHRLSAPRGPGRRAAGWHDVWTRGAP